MANADAMPCQVDECGNTARKGGLCWGHLKRRQRQLPVYVPLEERPLTPLQRLLYAAIRLAELQPTDDEGWQKARANLRFSAVRYARALKGAYRQQSGDYYPQEKD